MISFFANLFIKDSKNYQSAKVRQAYGVLCGSVGIGLNILLFLGKFLAGMISNSIAITADAFNNLSDAGSSLIMLLGFKMAGQKPDTDHPFGHGRIEYLSGLLVAIAILLMAVELLKSSFNKILHPSEIEFNIMVVIILGVSIAVKLYMFFYNRNVAKKIDSAAMLATAMDSISDTCATCVVLIATLVAHFTGIQIDGYCGTLVGFFILYAGLSAAKETIDPLLGQPAEADFVKKIEEIVLSFEEIQGIHDLVVHNYGPGRVMISLHAEVPAEGDIIALHDTIDTAEKELCSMLGCDAVIHMDPICTKDEETTEMKKMTVDKLHQIDTTLSLHDFRMVKGPTHINLIFDILVPYDCRIQDDDLLSQLENMLKEVYPDIYLVVKIDRSYVKM
ncbi:MAG: cation transporter [Lachnospiraceae bacterium]|nr:cation transporter [Lachnospiraceae bacterium]